MSTRPFVKLYADAYNSCAKFLSLREVDALSKTCTRFKDLTVAVRCQVKDLDLDGFQLTGPSLAQALKIHSGISRIRLANLSIDSKSMHALGQELHERVLKRIVLSQCHFDENDLQFLFEQISVFALEQLHISVPFRKVDYGLYEAPLKSLCARLKDCQSLKSLDLSSLSHCEKKASADLFLRSLPKSLEEFGPWPLHYCDEQIDFLIANFPFQNVYKYSFSIEKISSKKLQELMNLLPFSQMTHLCIFSGTFVTFDDLFKTICSKLIECEKLCTLRTPYLSLEQSTRLIPLLPAKMTDFPELMIDEQGIDCLVAKDLSLIKTCYLIGIDKPISKEKTRELLEALPLATMSQITLIFFKASLDQNNLEYLAAQTIQNKVSVCLDLHDNLEINWMDPVV